MPKFRDIQSEISVKIKDDNGIEKEVKSLVVDIEKVKSYGFMINIIITARGRGKTYGSKIEAWKRWKEKREVTFWIRNGKKDIESEKAEFFNKAPREYKDCYIAGSFDKNDVWVYDENDEKFIKLIYMSNAESEKGSRTWTDMWIMDEINVNQHLVTGYLEKFDSLFHSTEDDIGKPLGYGDNLQILAFGNNKSFNHILLYALGFTYIKDEYTELIDEYGNKLAVLWFEKHNEDFIKEFEERNKKNKRYQITKIFGMEKHSYFNESLYDLDTNFVYSYLSEIVYKDLGRFNNLFELAWTVKSGGRYYNVYNFRSKKNMLDTTAHIISFDTLKSWFKKFNVKYDEKSWMMKDDETGEPWFYNADKEPVEGSIKITPKLKDRLIKIMSSCELSFEDINSRELFCQSVIAR